MAYNNRNSNTGAIQAWIRGSNNVICDICGRKRKREEVVPAYGTGNIPVVISCTDGCADARHPLNDPPPVIFDGRPVENARPEMTDRYVASTQIGQTWAHIRFNPTWGAIGGLTNSQGFNLGFEPTYTWGSFP